MKEADAVIRQRLELLELAGTLGNVAEACRRLGVTRTQYYRYQRRYERHGIEGLRDLPPIAKSHPGAASPATIDRIRELATAHPAAGCNRLEEMLKGAASHVSSVTIQKHLGKLGLGSRRERWLALESGITEGRIVPSDEQVEFLETHNPCFRERHGESTRMGERLSQHTLLIGSFGRAGRLYLHSVVDTFSQHAFALFHGSKSAEAAITLLFEHALPFYERHETKPETIVTGKGREFCGELSHPYELFLLLNGIVHSHSVQTNGFTQRFHDAVRQDFMRGVRRRPEFDSVAELQQAFKHWLDRYNDTDKHHHGYRNRGLSPAMRILKRPRVASSRRSATSGG